MADKNTLITGLRRWVAYRIWSFAALSVAFLVVMPIVAIAILALFPSENIWPHLVSTTLPRYLGNSAILVLCVGALAGAAGTGAAWFLTMYQFPGARWLGWALLMPLAIPAYVGAYALVDFLEYAGPVQTGLRQLFGWETSRDYWFFQVRSMGMAIVVLSAALYPYVYLIVRAALSEQSASAFEVSRALGSGPWKQFWRVGMPLARPAIAASVAIVMMETVSDFGAVSYFAVQTLTTGIFATWLDGGNAGGAAQIASMILLVVLALVALEKRNRARQRFFQSPRHTRPVSQTQLVGWKGWAVFGLCFIPFAAGFLLPGLVIGSHALDNAGEWLEPGLLLALRNTVLVGGAAAIVTLIAALILTSGARLSAQTLPRKILPITTIGYAAPGAVLGVGILIPMSAFDHLQADVVLALTGHDPGLLFTGTAIAIVYAYCVRFFAVAQGAIDSALGRIPPTLYYAARSLGQNNTGVMARVTLPMIRRSVATALLLVFVDCVKELPATLLLRPFNFNTLSTRVYEKASLEQIGQAAPAAILVSLVGLGAVLIMARTNPAMKVLRRAEKRPKPRGVPL